MGTARHRRGAAVVAPLLLCGAVLVGCTSSAEPSASGDATGTPRESAPAAPSPTAAGQGQGPTSATPAPTVASTSTPATTGTPRPALPPDTSAAPTIGPGNDARDVPATTGAAARFTSCVEQYKALESRALPGPAVSTVQIEAWTEGYRAASQSAAEQDFPSAAAKCEAVVASMRSTLG